MCFQLEGRLCPCCAQTLPVAPRSLGEPEVLSKSYRPSGMRPLSLPAPPFGLVLHSSPLVPAALAARTPCCSSNTASTRPAQGLRTCRFCSHVSSRLHPHYSSAILPPWGSSHIRSKISPRQLFFLSPFPALLFSPKRFS